MSSRIPEGPRVLNTWPLALDTGSRQAVGYYRAASGWVTSPLVSFISMNRNQMSESWCMENDCCSKAVTLHLLNFSLLTPLPGAKAGQPWLWAWDRPFTHIASSRPNICVASFRGLFLLPTSCCWKLCKAEKNLNFIFKQEVSLQISASSKGNNPYVLIHSAFWGAFLKEEEGRPQCERAGKKNKEEEPPLFSGLNANSWNTARTLNQNTNVSQIQHCQMLSFIFKMDQKGEEVCVCVIIVKAKDDYLFHWRRVTDALYIKDIR